jgi:hypothetical protein
VVDNQEPTITFAVPDAQIAIYRIDNRARTIRPTLENRQNLLGKILKLNLSISRGVLTAILAEIQRIHIKLFITEYFLILFLNQ